MEAGIRYSSFLLTCQLNYKSELRAGGSRRQVRKNLKGNLAAASQLHPGEPRRAEQGSTAPHNTSARRRAAEKSHQQEAAVKAFFDFGEDAPGNAKESLRKGFRMANERRRKSTCPE